MKSFRNPIHQIIHDEVVSPALELKKDMVKALVVNYDNKRNRANIRFLSPYSDTYHTLDEVPVQLVGGISAAGPFPGDQVWVHFINGNLHMPRIVSVADEEHEEKTRKKRLQHSKKGAYVPDHLCGR